MNITQITQEEQEIISMVIAELKRAEKKFPKWPDNLIECAAIVGEESGELIRASLQYKYQNGNIESMREEAVQVAAMGIRFLKNLRQEKKEMENNWNSDYKCPKCGKTHEYTGSISDREMYYVDCVCGCRFLVEIDTRPRFHIEEVND